jgi:hypothetical protein
MTIWHSALFPKTAFITVLRENPYTAAKRLQCLDGGFTFNSAFGERGLL